MATTTVTPPPSITLCPDFEPKLKEQCLQAYSEYFGYEASVFRQREANFDFQLFSTKVILFMVVLLVLAGVTFAGLQFWYALVRVPMITTLKPASTKREAAAFAASAGNVSTQTHSNAGPLAGMMDMSSDIEVSTTCFKVKSSVLGLLLILISMRFFFLYIRYVYPIEEQAQPQSTAVTSPTTQK